MSNQALELIQSCYATGNPVLDLGNCGLTDKDVAAGTDFDTHLRLYGSRIKTLILSNTYYGWNEKGVYTEKKSRNTGTQNKFDTYPPALNTFVGLEELICAGEYENRWGISDMQFVAVLTNLKLLNLGGNQIAELKGLDNLTQLNQLIISDNQIAKLKGLDNLTQLNKLHISGNKIAELKGLDKLTQLDQLIISGNQIAELKGLDKLTQLDQLIISGNQIAELKELDKLTQLTKLYISGNKISELKGLDKLTQLDQLVISSNQIVELKGLDKLMLLTKLYISDNKIAELKGLNKLMQLDWLDISANHIAELKGLDNLTQLDSLDISNNQIPELKGLDNLTQLNKFDISNNQIPELKGLDKLTQLNKINISHNQIEDLGPLLVFLKRSTSPMRVVLKPTYVTQFGEINVNDNPLTTPPIEIVKRGNEAILRYFERIEKDGQEQVYEAKMVLAGSGESGKTSLSLRLNNRDCPLPKKDDRTKEVEVSDYKFVTTEKKDFTVHIWDFGGQQIVHHFHRLFMNESTLYILLTETSRENDDFDYWLQTIKLFGGESPILFIQNKRNGIPRGLNIQPYKMHFNIKDDLYNVNLLTNEGLQDVEKAIQYHIQQLPIVQRTIPGSWFKLREALSKISKSYIAYDEFVNICHSCGINGRVNIEDVGGFLHNLGNILWYKRNPALKQKIILEKQWSTKALFQLIFNEKINGLQKGYFTFSDAQSVWDSEREYCHHASQLIALMVEFKLAYKQRNKGGDGYIIPALLKSEQPKKEFITPKQIKIIYEYAHLPRGIVNQLTAEMCDKIEADENTWNEGVWLKYGNTEAKIAENRFDKIITVEIAGTQHRELFGAIKNTLDNLHSEYRGIKYELKIPCICITCKTSEDKHYFNYQDIITRIEAGKKTTIECVKSTEDVVLQELLDYLLPKQQTTKLYEIKESMETHFSKMHRSHEKMHDGINMIKNELSEQNEMIIDLVKLSNQSKEDLGLLLKKIDENVSNEMAYESLKNIINEMESVKTSLPKEIAEEWKKINTKPADDVDIKTKLKLKIPIIPLLLDYETEWSMDTKKLANKLRSFIF